MKAFFRQLSCLFYIHKFLIIFLLQFFRIDRFKLLIFSCSNKESSYIQNKCILSIVGSFSKCWLIILCILSAIVVDMKKCKVAANTRYERCFWGNWTSGNVYYNFGNDAFKIHFVCYYTYYYQCMEDHHLIYVAYHSTFIFIWKTCTYNTKRLWN